MRIRKVVIVRSITRKDKPSRASPYYFPPPLPEYTLAVNNHLKPTLPSLFTPLPHSIPHRTPSERHHHSPISHHPDILIPVCTCISHSPLSGGPKPQTGASFLNPIWCSLRLRETGRSEALGAKRTMKAWQSLSSRTTMKPFQSLGEKTDNETIPTSQSLPNVHSITIPGISLTLQSFQNIDSMVVNSLDRFIPNQSILSRSNSLFYEWMVFVRTNL
jgi:hypothetical protein